MADLNQDANGAKTKKIRSRKLNSRVDLTAMVDLAFLLITFFMLTTSLSKPRSMNLVMPSNEGVASPVDENRAMTILIGSDNKAICYMGTFGNKPTKTLTLGTRELRNELMKGQKQALAYSGNPEKGLIVIIKPGKKSNYGNLVDVLDEMAIVNIGSYAITDLTEREMKLAE
jgi:biopolymer transport protein ExbD